eukprot:gnl/Dysnectes_brevis/429_a472_3377.p1 GENE.gnl/Dysnectes_brevis/429_a472_3377~~gnl/Dysnectes_brevis/429_a472_3377.p1  ORF type:complete len:697 (+),score=327.93 gnl/Dysnectes_brevis/429_a472_3377:31-2121(+)
MSQQPAVVDTKPKLSKKAQKKKAKKAKKGKKAPPPFTLHFDVTAIPYALGCAASLAKKPLGYFVKPEEEADKPTYLKTPSGMFSGHMEILGFLLPDLDQEAKDKVREALAMTPDQLGALTLDTPFFGGEEASVLDYIMLDRITTPSEALTAWHAAMSASRVVKSSRGQMSVALKRWEREHLSFGPKLPNAEIGAVRTRFPPEPSGYLHIGHAKAAVLNHFLARKYKGTLHFRLDDTNPAKESTEFVESIKSDLKWLGIDYDSTSHSSDLFPLFQKYAQDLIDRGIAYADCTPSAQMRQERMDGVESQYRTATVEETTGRWQEMLSGSEEGKRWCLRVKIDMADPNKCMRDPVIFRVNTEHPHPITGTDYKAYPTYDFATTITDSTEGITHVLRTTEFLDRNAQYRWLTKTMGLRCPELLDFSRLNMQHTVMSKRFLQSFVDAGLVTGWDDPRFPTLRGLRRRGLTQQGLKAFMLGQGLSRKVNSQEWDKIWSMNKDTIEPIARRFNAVSKSAVTVRLDGVEGVEERELPFHKKNPDLGMKRIVYGPRVIIEASDLAPLAVGSRVTLMNWGVFKVTAVGEEPVFEYLEGDTDFMGTAKLTWVAADQSLVPLKLVYFGHLITEAKMLPGTNPLDLFNPESKKEFTARGSAAMQSVKPGDIIQIERKGFYYCDAVEGDALVLHYVPEGKKKGQAGSFQF